MPVHQDNGVAKLIPLMCVCGGRVSNNVNLNAPSQEPAPNFSEFTPNSGNMELIDLNVLELPPVKAFQIFPDFVL